MDNDDALTQEQLDEIFVRCMTNLDAIWFPEDCPAKYTEED